MRGVLISGMSSGCGKTVATMLVMNALRRKGFSVQPFKVGPDYIDPMFHESLCDRPSRNLDWWMMGTSGVVENFYRGMDGASIGVVEGVMGHFDGVFDDGLSSSHHISKILGLPVILVVDAGGVSQSVEAYLRGFCDMSGGAIKGVIFNRVGGEKHILRLERIAKKLSLRLCGFIRNMEELLIPERHLGLFFPHEVEGLIEFIEESSGEFIDVDEVLRVAEEFHPVPFTPSRWPLEGAFSGVEVTVFRDKAFSFLYTESLEALEKAGCKVHFISPLSGEGVPSSTKAVIIPGGYPEIYAEQISQNTRLIRDIREFSEYGPIYGECGGLIFLSESVAVENRVVPMSGVFDIRVSFSRSPLLGYGRGFALPENPFLKENCSLKGHIFHYSHPSYSGYVPDAYRVYFPEGGDVEDGFCKGKVMATYLHTNLYWCPKLLSGILEAGLEV